MGVGYRVLALLVCLGVFAIAKADNNDDDEGIELGDPVFVAVISRSSGARLQSKGNYQEVNDMLRVVDWNRSLPNALRQHYNLGKRLSSDYGNLLNWNSSRQDFTYVPIIMRSFPYDFYVEQAQAQMAGLMSKANSLPVEFNESLYEEMLPPLARSLAKELTPNLAQYNLSREGEFGWAYEAPDSVPSTKQSAIPVKTFSRKNSFTFIADQSQQCKGITDENAFEYSHFLAENSKKFASLATELNKSSLSSQTISGKKAWELEDMASLYTQLEAGFQAKGYLPNNVDDGLLSKLRLVRGIYLLAAKVSNSAENARVYTNGIGRCMLEEMFPWVNEAYEAREQVKRRNAVAAYLVDAATMLAIMSSLGLVSQNCYLQKYTQNIFDFFEPDCLPFPEYSANLVFELRKINNPKEDLVVGAGLDGSGEFAVQILYNGAKIKLARCGGLDYCDYGRFKQIISTDLFLDSIETKCGYAKMTAYKYYWMLIICMLFSSILLIILTCRIKKRQEEMVQETQSLEETEFTERF